MEAMHALTTRRSVRRYKPEPVPQDRLLAIANAGRLAPSARNEQPCEFVIVTEPAGRRRIAEIADYGKFIADAAACIVVLARPTGYYLEDGSAATTNMLNAATALGLGSCWVAGDKKAYAPKIIAEVGAPADYRLVSLIAIGVPAETPQPDKRPLEDIVHWERFER